MSVFLPRHVEMRDGFQNDDLCGDWLSHDPEFEWSEEDKAEFDREELYAQMQQQAMAAWWEDEGVRCATFGRNPQENPYLW